jgi:hypothetical protein
LSRSRLEPAPVGLAFDDEFVSGAGEPVDGALGADRIGEGGEPFIGSAVGGDDHGAGAMPLDHDLVDVAAFGEIHGIEREVVDEEQVGGEEFAQFRVIGVVEAGVLEVLEHAVGPQGEDGVAMAAGHVPEGVGEEGLADPDRADVDRRGHARR